MPTVPLYDRAKCRQRARLAARSGRVEACRVRLAGPGPQALAKVPDGADLVSAAGTMPAGDAEALDRVNAVLAHQGLAALPAEKVHVHYLEAGNSNFIPSLAAHLADSTLKNIAGEAQRGFAFMNSHATGTLSAPAQQPYGRTFAGRFESYGLADGRRWSRCVLGFYMLAGVRPNGDQGPTTDDLSAAIDGGTTFDASLAVNYFKPLCDVCGADLRERDEEYTPLCPHVPGTTHKLTRDERRAQKGRGVPGGVATYSLHDGHAGEVSAVYNGAVPGAGFSRALAASRRGVLTRAELAEARVAYAPLLSGPRPPGRDHFTNRGPTMPLKLKDIFAKIGLSPDHTVDDDGTIHDPEEFDFTEEQPPARKPPAPPPTTDPALAKLQEQLAETNRRLAESEEQRKQEARAALAEKWAGAAAQFGEAHKGKLTPAQLKTVVTLHEHLARLEHDHPTKDVSLTGSLGALLSEFQAPKAPARIQGQGDPQPDPAAPKTYVLSNAGDEGYDPVKAAKAQNAEFSGGVGIKRKTTG